MKTNQVVPLEKAKRKPTRKVCWVAEPNKTVPSRLPGAGNAPRTFPTNHVVTSKYTKLNFLPKFLMEQFYKLANVWFLIVSVLELVPEIAISEPGTGTVGVLVLMLVIEAIAQLVEDGKRKKADDLANASPSQVFEHSTKAFKSKTWKDLRCGDVVKVHSFEVFPADLLILCSSEGMECYVETKSLDGETNLKLRQAPKVLYDSFRRLHREKFGGSSVHTPRSPRSPRSLRTDQEMKIPESLASGAKEEDGSMSAIECPDFELNEELLAHFKGCRCDGQDPRDELTSGAIDVFQGKIILTDELAEIAQEPESSSKGMPLNEKNIALRGCSLRNTDYIYGLVVNTGRDTKIMKSSTAAPSKASAMDRTINQMLIFFLGLLLLTCAIGTVMHVYWANSHLWWEEELFGGGTGAGTYNQPLALLSIFGQLFITMAQIIPISLYVTMKMARGLQTFFMHADTNMVHVIPPEFSTTGEEMVIKPRVRTVDLNDDIGQISYIFSDKTGTLTQNIMEFRKCSINGVSYGSGTTMIGIAALIKDGKLEEAKKLKESMAVQATRKHLPYCNLIDFDEPEKSIVHALKQNDEQSEMIRFFFKHLSLCHSVSVESVYENVEGKRVKTEKTRLSASSPDEQALVAGAKGMGFNFVGDSTEGGIFRIVEEGPTRLNGEDANNAETKTKKYVLLDVLEFTSKRKRMSVIILENGEAASKGAEEPRIRIFSKGADNVIFERLRDGQDPEVVAKTTQHLSAYADDGLRTLAIATATIPKDRYNAWKNKFSEVLLDEDEEIKRKAQLPNKIDDVMAEIETELDLIGATAIEDKLQNGVPDAVANLAKAGIKIWVLTGDKQETAINIGFATQLLRRDMDRTILNGLNSEGSLKTPEKLIYEMEQDLRRLGEKRKATPNMPVQALIVDGKALDIVFSSQKQHAKVVQKRLLEFVRQCGAVVACRVSPLQKAQMVNLVKRNEKGAKTLSIGDGANDVPMIQMAHVGVGISGQEGMQAVNASDYAIGQFCFLSRLLLVHGRWNYRRMALLVCYMFYKNVILCLVPWIYFLLVSFSSTEGGSLMIVGRTPFNVAYTGFPILLLGVYDRDISQWMVQRYPRLYRSGHAGDHFNTKIILVWMMYAIYHSFIAFFAAVYIAPEGGHTSTMGIAEFGFYGMYFTIIITNLKLSHATEMWFWW